jgi:branched-chain amino acid transport system ATP-binding protein
MKLLEVRDLTRRFAGLIAVNRVSFDVEQGAITALIGPNGAGKTTTFNMIAGALAPSSGSIAFAGQHIVGLAPETLCRLGIARTFQIVRPLTGMSVLDNVVVGALNRAPSLHEARDIARDLIERVGLGAKMDAPASALTLPDRKLLETAKALATQPRLLMLDEVMAGLRPAEADRVIAVLQAARADGVTILLIEHVMRVVMAIAERVVVLNYGEKIAEGDPAAVVSDRRVIESYLGTKAVAP